MRETSVEILVSKEKQNEIHRWLEKQFEEQDKKCAEALGITLEEWKNKVLESTLQCRKNAVVQVDALIDAGWKFEIPNSPDSEPWQWQWRRPARRKGSKGMLFWSTNQAYQHLQRSLKSQ